LFLTMISKLSVGMRSPGLSRGRMFAAVSLGRKDIAAELKERLGLTTCTYKANLSKKELFHEAIANDRGRIKLDGGYDEQKAYPTSLGDKGPLMYLTDPSCTGRPTSDTHGVAWPEFNEKVWWKADFNKFPPEKYEALLKRAVDHLNEKKATLYVKDVYCGWDPEYSIPYRFVGEYATHAYFVHNMFPKGIKGVANEDDKAWITLNVPSLHTDPARDGTPSNRVVIVDIRNKIYLVCGNADYCGINKKGMFCIMNFMLPEQGIFPMHCSANVGKAGDTALLFGLSGTGKTTLSADPDRLLIGDDEHAWTHGGVSNFEDGCYAKLINLDKKAEPIIAAAMSMDGSVIENVPPLPNKPFEQTDPQELDLDNNSITDNTRISYPLDANPNVAEGAKGPHPKTIVLLTADAFGVLPPVCVLDADEVMYHFVQGFTSRLAGTEIGVKEPQPIFSACYGAPFMVQKVSVYADLLSKYMKEYNSNCVMLNTGWSGGGYGVGKRISIDDTRNLLDAALRGDFNAPGVEYEVHPQFNMRYPKACKGVNESLLNPRNTWDDKEAYDKEAVKLRDMFRKNFDDKKFADLGIAAKM